MKQFVQLSIMLLFVSLVFGFNYSDARAETVNYQITSYVVRSDFVTIPDAEKHVVGLFERRGVAIYKNGETAAYHTKGTFDFTKGNGPFQRYGTSLFKDGSTTISKYQGTMSYDPKEKKQTYSGKGEYIKDTGKYKGIKGTFSYSAVFVNPFNEETKGDVVVDVTANYTLPE